MGEDAGHGWPSVASKGRRGTRVVSEILRHPIEHLCCKADWLTSQLRFDIGASLRQKDSDSAQVLPLLLPFASD